MSSARCVRVTLTKGSAQLLEAHRLELRLGVRVRLRVRVRVRFAFAFWVSVGVRVRLGDYFLRLHTPFPIPRLLQRVRQQGGCQRISADTEWDPTAMMQGCQRLHPIPTIR